LTTGAGFDPTLTSTNEQRRRHPMITFTESAAAKLADLLKTQAKPEEGLRVRVVGGGCSGLSYQLEFDQPQPADQVFEAHGAKVLVDPKSYLYLAGTELDYIDGLQGAGFSLKNPNAKGGCGCGSSFTA
jgi:iron-sulfur cluster assembly accessory protein